MSLPQFLIPIVVAGFVVFLALAFVIWYWRPSWRLRGTLKSVIPALQALKTGADIAPVDRDQIAQILVRDATLAHLWSEYTETLHEQHDLVDGERRLIAVRATVPAEVFFNTQVLVDTPLNTEFFRHLPGLLTGIGIIGTFSGLILGLSGFEPTGSAEAVKVSLGALMEGVQEAFYASAVAITAAMVITFVEKRELNRRYKQIEQLAQAIDTLFEAGAGEEYLARLVKAAEESATQTRQLKQSLVDDLKQILTDLADRQIQASQQHSQQMAEAVGDAIRNNLGPIAEVVERASGQQGTAVQNMLQDLLAAFMAKIEETFGGQMRGLNDMLGQSVNSMREMQTEFSKLVADLRQVGQANAEELSTKLTDMLAKAETRQLALVARMGDFLAEVRSAMGETQASTRQQMEETLHAVHQQMQSMTQSLEAQRVAAGQAEESRHDQLKAATGSMVEGMKSEVERLVSEVATATAAMERNISALQSTSTSAIDRMNSGAETMYLAAGEFTKAGDIVSEAVNSAGDTFDQLRQAARAMGDASGHLSTQVASLERIQTGIGQMASTLQEAVERARQEAGASRQLVADMQAAARQLGEAGQQAGEYLERVNEALEKAFTTFGDAVARELGRSNAAFQSELGTGTEILKTAFNELAAVIGQFQNRR